MTPATKAAARAAYDLGLQAMLLFGGFYGLLLIGELAYLVYCRLTGNPPAPGGCWGP